jgi:hypothetical protein
MKPMRMGTKIDGCTVLAHDVATKFALIYDASDYLARMSRNAFTHYRVGRVEAYPDGRPAYMADAPSARYFADLDKAIEAYRAAIEPHGPEFFSVKAGR